MSSLARRHRLVLALAIAGMTMISAHAVTIDWVTVGDPGNAADTTGYGAVATSFQIMKFEWTNAQYVDFLNAVDPNGTIPTRSTTRQWAATSEVGSVSQAATLPAASTLQRRTWATSR
jgi:hypothetical protein